ncbi:MAG: hypothetical protein ACYDCN_02570 [Bacteroidia bacterium]
MDTYTCDQCGRKFENKNLLKQFRVAKLGKDFCSSGCEKAYERDHEGPKSTSSVSSSNDDDSSDKEVELLEAQLDHEKDMLEEKQEHELRLENIRSSSDAVERINGLDFGGHKPTPEVISSQIEFCITIATSHLSETFDDIGWKKEREKYNLSEKVINAAIKKAELGTNKLKLCEPLEKGMQYFGIYKEQVNEVKIKQIKKSYEIQIKQAKPETWIWFACIFFFPALLYPIYKTVNAMVLLPKKREAEIAQLK